jgi:hypothetical protein
VSWFDEEMLKSHGRGEMELLFRLRSRAESFARAINEGQSQEILALIAAARLK